MTAIQHRRTQLLTFGSECLSAAFCFLTFVSWTYQTRGSVTGEGLFFLLRFTMIAGGLGVGILAVLGLCRSLPRSFPLFFLTGAVSYGLATIGLRFCSPLSMPLIEGALLVTALALCLSKRRQLLRWRLSSTGCFAGVAATLLCLMAATFWTRHYFPPTVVSENEVIFKPIRDYFTHSHQVTLLGSEIPPRELGQYGLHGYAAPLYHYASYAFPGMYLASDRGITAYETLIALWLPLSFALVGFAAYCLGCYWFGYRGGLVSAAAAVALPDPTFWTIGTPVISLYSVDRFIQFAPANAYAIASEALALLIVLMSIEHNKLAAFIYGWSLALLSLFFKAQVFTAAVPLLGLVTVLALLAPPNRRFRQRFRILLSKRFLIVGIVTACIAGGVFGPLFLRRAPEMKLEIPPGEQISEFLVTVTSRSDTLSPLALLAANGRGFEGLLLRALLIAVISLQWWLLLWPMTAVWLWMQVRKLGLAAAVPLIAFLLYLGIALFIAPNRPGYEWGHPWDLQHVPFAWVYLLVVTWTAGAATTLIAPARLGTKSLGLLLLLLLLWPFRIGGDPMPDDSLTDLRWAYLPVPKGLVESARFIREHAEPTDLIQDSNDDPYFLFEALAQRRAWVGWTVVASYTAKTPLDPVFRERLKVHQKAKEATSVAAVQRFAKETGIRWYLLDPGVNVDWPEQILNRPTFSADDYRVYDLKSLSNAEL